MADPIDISVVVPVFDEEDSLRELHREVVDSLDSMGGSWELLFVDDCSTDSSLRVMLELRAADDRVRVIRFRRNFGQTAALSAGFDHSRGEIVVTLDGDLQNDPADIPRLVEGIHQGHDIVAGWRRRRQDDFLRRLPSRAANRLINLLIGTHIHDTGCTLKAFRRQLVRNLPIYAEQHRFLPAMAASSGARVAEREVNHRARRYGSSKYGLGRATRVLLDLLVIKMIAQFAHRPLHYFGLFSVPFGGLSLFFLLVGTVDLRSGELLEGWLQFAVFIFLLLLLVTVYFVLLGLLSELAVTASGMHRRRVLDRIIAELH